MFKKIVKERLISILDQKNKFSSKQFALPSKRSTISAPAEFTKQLRQGSTDTSMCKSCDLRKSFDSFIREVFSAKPEKYGVTGTCCRWFESFSKQRRQCVLVNDLLCYFLYLLVLIPQGSFLEPLLLLISVNKLGLNIYESQAKTFLKKHGKEIHLSSSIFERSNFENCRGNSFNYYINSNFLIAEVVKRLSKHFSILSRLTIESLSYKACASPVISSNWTGNWIWYPNLWLYFKKQNATYFYFIEKDTKTNLLRSSLFSICRTSLEINVLSVYRYYTVELPNFPKSIRSVQPTEYLNSLYECEEWE